MMKTFVGVCVLAILVCSAACIKVKSYPNTPQIELLSASLVDSQKVKAIIQFTDGDGDIGLAEADTFAPYDSASKYHNNLIVEYFEMRNGTWIKDSEFKYRIQPITPPGKVKVLEGEIEISLFYNIFSPFDTVKYSFQLFDRALHESNKTETGGIVIDK